MHNKKEWLLKIDGTSTGKGPMIYVRGDDGYDEEIADLGTSVVRRGQKRFRMVRTPDADEIEANARLMRAAPKLLDACKELIRFFDSTRPCGRVLSSDPNIDAARNAVILAERPDSIPVASED